MSWTSQGVPRPGAQAPAEAHAGPIVDRRGLTAAGAVAVALLLGGAGVLVDVLVGSGLGAGFAICFIAGCALAAVTAHREDLVAVVVMPPLLYVLLAAVGSAFAHATTTGSMLTREAVELTTALVVGAPVLLTATGVTFVLALIRGVTGRRRRTA